MKQLVALSLLVLALPARAGYDDLQAARTAEHIAAIRDYHGVLEETGLYAGGTVVSEVAFRRPHDIRTRITAPAELAGTITAYSPDEFLLYAPRQELAVRIRHFVPPDAAGEATRVGDAYRTNIAGYFYGLGKVGEVAGHATIGLEQRARRPVQLVQSSTTQVYDDYSLPLAGSMTLRGGARLDYRYREFAVNDGRAEIAPLPVLPAATMVVDWDLAAPPRSEADVAARLPRAVSFPAGFAGVPRERLLVHPDALPAVAAWYRDANYYLLFTASRDTGFVPLANGGAPREYGLDVPLGDGGTRARVVLTPGLSTWTFRRDGVLYTVLSNLHPETIYRELTAGWAGVEKGAAARTTAAATTASRTENHDKQGKEATP